MALEQKYMDALMGRPKRTPSVKVYKCGVKVFTTKEAYYAETTPRERAWNEVQRNDAGARRLVMGTRHNSPKIRRTRHGIVAQDEIKPIDRKISATGNYF